MLSNSDIEKRIHSIRSNESLSEEEKLQRISLIQSCVHYLRNKKEIDELMEKLIGENLELLSKKSSEICKIIEEATPERIEEIKQFLKSYFQGLGLALA